MIDLDLQPVLCDTGRAALERFARTAGTTHHRPDSPHPGGLGAWSFPDHPDDPTGDDAPEAT